MDNPNGILNDLLSLWPEQKTTNKPNDSDHQATPSTMLGQVSNNHKNDSNICTAVPSSTLFQDLVMEDDTMDNTDDCENNPSIALHHLNTFAGLEKRSDSRFMSQSRNGHKKPCKDQLMKRGNEHIGPSYLAKSSCRIQKSHRRYHSPHVIRILRSWLMQHLDNPYPNPDEKVMLRVKTGMTATQLNDWFTNARRRNIPKILGENKHCMNSPQYANAITMPSAPNTMRMTTSLPQYQTYDYNPQSLVGLGLQEWPMYRQHLAKHYLNAP
ncbi:hypothetical protein BDF22DRAFT_740975 [Syncephalis plumigaleata]|nr:hypothetical protein BDF22DRAFT_740975 [Syncephalis plumigaleata]